MQEVRKKIKTRGRGRPPKYNRNVWEKLYDSGLNDCAIARQSGADASTVREWRKGKGLPAVGKAGRPRKHNRSVWETLYDSGLNDGAIARQSGAHEATVFRWRIGMGLPAVGTAGRPRRQLDQSGHVADGFEQLGDVARAVVVRAAKTKRGRAL